MIKNKNTECWIMIVTYIVTYFILLSLWNSIDANMKYWALMEFFFFFTLIPPSLRSKDSIISFNWCSYGENLKKKFFLGKNSEILEHASCTKKKWLCNRNGNYSLFLDHCISTCDDHQIVWYIILTKWSKNKYAESERSCRKENEMNPFFSP